jgi:RNA polymerase sigma-70 factor (ECF subfamily)
MWRQSRLRKRIRLTVGHHLAHHDDSVVSMTPGANASKSTDATSARDSRATDSETDDAANALERAAAGDREALLALYDRYATVLMGVAFRITRSHAEAEEVLQDAMTRAWLEAPTFDRRRGSALTWLVTLTRNRAIDVVRARGRRTEYETASFDAESEPVSTPEHETSDAQRARAVRSALALLSDDQRRTLDLAYFSGLSHSEIAAHLGQPLGTVKTRILQAVRILRAELARFDSNHAPSAAPDRGTRDS